jgi:hypothetical protein
MRKSCTSQFTISKIVYWYPTISYHNRLTPALLPWFCSTTAEAFPWPSRKPFRGIWCWHIGIAPPHGQVEKNAAEGSEFQSAMDHVCSLLFWRESAFVLSHLKVYASVIMLNHFKAHTISVYLQLLQSSWNTTYKQPYLWDFRSSDITASGEAKPSLRPAIFHSLAPTSILQVGVYYIYKYINIYNYITNIMYKYYHYIIIISALLYLSSIPRCDPHLRCWHTSKVVPVQEFVGPGCQLAGQTTCRDGDSYGYNQPKLSVWDAQNRNTRVQRKHV